MRKGSVWIRIRMAAVGLILCCMVVITILNRRRFPKLPIPPPGATNVYRQDSFLCFGRQLYFETTITYPSLKITDDVDAWAAKNGWTRVSPDEENWVSSGWDSYPETTKEGKVRWVDTFRAHWASPGRHLSLRIAVFYWRERRDMPRGPQRISIWMEPFGLLSQ